MRTRRGFILSAILGLATVMLPAPIAAQSDVGVTGAAEGTFPNGATFNGVALRGLELGQGLFIAPDGSANGQFNAVLRGTSFLGLAQDVIVEGKVTGGSAAVNGSVTFSGTATLNMGDGTLPTPEVPFAATVSANGLALILNATSLPKATLTAGSITIE
jgi:hypothetical protein